MKSKDKHLLEKISPFSNQIEECEQLLASSLGELFSNAPASSIQMRNSSNPITALNFKAIKECLRKKDITFCCAILKALRWRVSRAESIYQRRQAIIQFTSNNLLDYELFTFLLERKSQSVTEHLLSLTNTLASEYLGRSYLLENPSFTKCLIQLMKLETSDTFIRRNCLGIVQKLSLRKRPQEILIQNDIIRWSLNVLSSEKSSLSNYSLEYLCALILNLSLRTIGKDKFEEIRFSVMSFLRDYMCHSNSDIRTYVNGTMYSLFTRNSLKNLALETGFEERLQKIIHQSDEALAKRYKYVLAQLLNESPEANLSELNEDENDMDLIDEDEFWIEEENENAPEVEFMMEGEELLVQFKLEAEEAEKQNNITSTIMEETINVSKLEFTRGGSRKRDYEFPRPSTPIRQQLAQNEKKLKPENILTKEQFQEEAQAFLSRPKVGF